jgi:GGDEF domain-containing protein
LIVDAGHFKRFNDRYGHQVGDEVLQGLARRLSTSVHRPHDLVCRVGGEEFAILLTTPAFAQVIETPISTTVIVPLGAPGVVTRQPGSTGEEGAATYSPSGRQHLIGLGGSG